MTFSFDTSKQTSFFGNAVFRPPPRLPQQPFSVDYGSNSFMSTNTAGFSFNSASTMNNSMSKEPASQPHHQAPSFSFGNRPNSLSNQYANFSFGSDQSTSSTLNSFTFGNASISPTNQSTFSFNLPSSSQRPPTFSFNPSPLTNALASANTFSFTSSSSAHSQTTETMPLQPYAVRENLESSLIAKHYVKAHSTTDQYNDHSFEELRLKDYQQSRKSYSAFNSASARNTPPLLSQGTASLSSQQSSLPASNPTSASQYSPYTEILVDSENHTSLILSYFSLTADPHFNNYSSEELRWMDYQGLQGSKRPNPTEPNTTVKTDHASLPKFSFGDRTSTGQIGADVRDIGGSSTSTLQNRNNGTDNPRSVASTVRLNREDVTVNATDTSSNRAGVSRITRQTITDTQSRRPRQNENRNSSVGDRSNHRQPSDRYRSERSVQPSREIAIAISRNQSQPFNSTPIRTHSTRRSSRSATNNSRANTIIINPPRCESSPTLSDNDSPIESAENIPETETCKICFGSRIDCAFINCGHTMCCTSCAVKLADTRKPLCPICREKIKAVLKLYRS